MGFWNKYFVSVIAAMPFDLYWPIIPVQVYRHRYKNYRLAVKATSRCRAFTSRALYSRACFYEWNRSGVIHKTERRLVAIRWNEVDLVFNDVKCDIFSLRLFFVKKYRYKEYMTFLSCTDFITITFSVIKSVQDTKCPLLYIWIARQGPHKRIVCNFLNNFI